MDNDEKLLEALKANWEYVRHIDMLRLRLVTVYILASLGPGLAAINSDQTLLRLLGASIGLLITVFCWGMTYKWNVDFVSMMRKADACARQLSLDGKTKRNLHAYLPFPTRPNASWVNVRLMFNLLFGTFALLWVVLGVLAVSGAEEAPGKDEAVRKELPVDEALVPSSGGPKPPGAT